MAQDWNNVTMKYIASLENIQYAIEIRYKNAVESGEYTRINPLDTIPLEELNDINIPIEELVRRYKVGGGKILKYRRDNNLIKWNSIDVIPLEELNSPFISTRNLMNKYNVSMYLITKYRNELGIKFNYRVRIKTNPISVIPVQELNDVSISTNDLVRKYNCTLVDIREYRRKNGIKYNYNKAIPNLWHQKKK